MWRHRPNTSPGSEPESQAPVQVSEASRWRPNRRPVLTSRSRPGRRMLREPNRLRSRAPRRVPTWRRRPPAGPETQAASEAATHPVEAKPPQESRRGGSGKHDHGRSRGSRPKPPASPPPPPTPPAPHAADPLLAQLAYVIVNEAGASVYSTSQIGREELPEFDATLHTRSRLDAGFKIRWPSWSRSSLRISVSGSTSMMSTPSNSRRRSRRSSPVASTSWV